MACVASPRTPPRKLFEKSFLGTFKNFEWPKTPFSAEVDYNRAVAPASSLWPLSFPKRKRRKEKGGSTEVLTLQNSLCLFLLRKRKRRKEKGNRGFVPSNPPVPLPLKKRKWQKEKDNRGFTSSELLMPLSFTKKKEAQRNR